MNMADVWSKACREMFKEPQKFHHVMEKKCHTIANCNSMASNFPGIEGVLFAYYLVFLMISFFSSSSSSSTSFVLDP